MSDRSRFFQESPWTAGIIGLGYVGLPLAAAAAQRDLGVVGFDTSEDVVNALQRGTSHVDDVSNADLAAALERGAAFTSDPSHIATADAIFICVPSPLGRNREPDLSHIDAAARTVSEVARAGQLIALETL